MSEYAAGNSLLQNYTWRSLRLCRVSLMWNVDYQLRTQIRSNLNICDSAAVRSDSLNESIRIYSVSPKIAPFDSTTTCWSLYANLCTTFANYWRFVLSMLAIDITHLRIINALFVYKLVIESASRRSRGNCEKQWTSTLIKFEQSGGNSTCRLCLHAKFWK